ncbi:MAG: ABC transporter substrate-binding protein [Nitrospinae bacterium]|nr:ABC transporter substrate-binding protein [Nitrospinota bacterium]
MKKKIFNFILLCYLGFYGLAYAEPESLRGTDMSEQLESIGDPFLQAEHLFHAGDFLEAKPYYHEYLSQNPSGKRSHQAFYRLGSVDQANKSYSTAIRFYQILLQNYPRSIWANSARFNMAVCYYELEDYDNAESMFKMVLRSTTDNKRKWNILIHLARIDVGRMSFEKAFIKLRKVYTQNENEDIRNNVEAIAKDLISDKLGEDKVSNLIQKLGTGFPVDLLLLRKVSIARAAGDISNYVATLKNFIELFPGHPLRGEMETRINNVEADAGTKIKIGVVLPLTGKLALTGQRVLQGIQLAVNQLPFQAREKLALEVRDSGSQVSISKIISEVSDIPSVVGIIGPLLSDEVKVAGEMARKKQIPVFSPTASTNGLVDENPFLFRNALTRRIQAKFLAQYSVNTLHLKRFAVLHPYEPFGLELKETFINEVESLGGEIVAIAGYDRSQNDFKKQILELGGVEDDDLDKIAREMVLEDRIMPDFSDSSTLSRPLIDMGHWSGDDVEKLKVSLELSYDAIFIPGVYDKVGLIIPQLAFYNINKAVLLGAKGWNSPELVRMGGKYLKTVYFVDGYYPDSHQIEVRKFVENFITNFGEEPTNLSAQAFDAANIVIKNILAGADNRIKFLESLRNVKSFPGVTGKTTLLPSGDSEKNIFALTVKRKKIVQQN